jgi:hypothetical protein
MALAAIIGAALLSAVSGGLKLSEKAQRRAGASVALLSQDDRIRAAVGQVRIPYWERSAEIEREGNDLVIPWFGGTKERTLRIGIREKRLFMEADGIVSTFEGIENPELRPLPSGTAPLALEIVYEAEGRALRILAPFGAHPLGAGPPGDGE